MTIENAQNLRYEVDGNLLKIYPANRILGEVRIKAFEGIKSEYGYTLKKSFSELAMEIPNLILLFKECKSN